MTVPQTDLPGVPATPQVRDVSVTLPRGMTLSPAAADGLQACSDAQFAEHEDGTAQCPPASQIGTVSVTTPLLAGPLEGQLFVGEPECGNVAHPRPCEPSDAQEGRLFRLFLQASGSGVTVKRSGVASVDPSGQVTAAFKDNPQLPFSELTVHLDGGPQAPLATPQECGEASTSSDIVPWSTPETGDANPLSTFIVSGCENPLSFSDHRSTPARSRPWAAATARWC